MPVPHNPNSNHDRPAIAVLDTAGRHNDLPLLTAAVRSQDGQQEQQIVRQWRILKLLTYSPEGFTVRELAVLSGMNEKTVRRDLVFLQHIGFDMAETVEERGRKRWRIRRLPESVSVRGSVREKYGLIHDTLGDLHDAALIVGDSGLAFALKRLQEWVEGKCRGRKVKPR
ncbi:MAG: hypothetical protein RBS80_22680 [Thermoguttaceae bacterium]|jgi:hypothetical protein|nr:hypothetical protein [Thermoguttaceae bacterium]